MICSAPSGERKNVKHERLRLSSETSPVNRQGKPGLYFFKMILEIYVDDEKIILKKYKPNMTCQVTGEVSDDNLKLAGGKLVLSPEGAEQIISGVPKRKIYDAYHIQN